MPNVGRGKHKDRIHDPYSWAVLRIRAAVALALTREGSMSTREAEILRDLDEGLQMADPSVPPVAEGIYDLVLRVKSTTPAREDW